MFYETTTSFLWLTSSSMVWKKVHAQNRAQEWQLWTMLLRMPVGFGFSRYCTPFFFRNNSSNCFGFFFGQIILLYNDTCIFIARAADVVPKSFWTELQFVANFSHNWWFSPLLKACMWFTSNQVNFRVILKK